MLERNLLSRLWRCHPRVFKGLELNVTAGSHISANDAHPSQDCAALHQHGGEQEHSRKRDVFELTMHSCFP